MENIFNPTMELLIQAILDGDRVRSIREVKLLLEAGVETRQVITDGVEAAMRQLDAKCTVVQFNLLEIMLSGRAVMDVIKVLYPPDAPIQPTRETIVIGSLEGDVHDLGKSILKMVLTVSGFKVVDCGKDCPMDRLIDTAETEMAFAIGISGLITTVIPQVRRVKDRLAERGLDNIKVMVGGAALKQAMDTSLNVDYVAQNVFDGLHYLEQISAGEK